MCMKCLCSIVTVAGRLRTRFEGKISDSHIQNFNMTVVIVIFLCTCQGPEYGNSNDLIQVLISVRR